jgi:hypothetical protein
MYAAELRVRTELTLGSAKRLKRASSGTVQFDGQIKPVKKEWKKREDFIKQSD